MLDITKGQLLYIRGGANMSVIKIRNELGQFVDIPALQGEKGDKGDKGDTGPQGPKGDTGPQGPSGASVAVIQATDENNAISLSQSNPNNIYFWEE